MLESIVPTDELPATSDATGRSTPLPTDLNDLPHRPPLALPEPTHQARLSVADRLLIDGDRVELATAPEGGALVARYVGADAVRLSPASLETLAIVAYRQPVTKAAIERIRGVDSDYTVRTLMHRRLLVELGRSDAPGRPFLYGTGFEFLERFGLTSLEELPFLDVDVASRLGEEGGDPVTQPMFPEGDLAAAAVGSAARPVGTDSDLS